MMKVKLIALSFFSLVFFVSCNNEVDKTTSLSSEVKTASRNINPVHYSQGARLYQLNCAKCHGKDAEGNKDWRRLDENGKNPPPPLNGNGHTWHHSNKSLFNTIKNGTAKIGGNMPAWKDKLSNHEIKLILTWITAQWSDEIYTAWYNRFHQSR